MPYDVASLSTSLDLPARQRPVTGSDLVLQRVRLRLSTHLGEWPEDASVGLPYLTWIQASPFPRAAVTARLIQEIRTTPGVADVRRLSDSYDAASSAYQLECQIILDDDDDAVRLGIEIGPQSNGVPWAAITMSAA